LILSLLRSMISTFFIVFILFISIFFIFFFFNATATTEIYTLSLHDALPISLLLVSGAAGGLEVFEQIANARSGEVTAVSTCDERSEEHTSELQSRFDLVCRLLLEKKK